jgi:hypothetical protein
MSLEASSQAVGQRRGGKASKQRRDSKLSHAGPVRPPLIGG